MREVEKNISQYIESQFPDIYRDEGPVLVRFVTAYYEWLESTGQPLFHARNLPSYRDIDSTIDEFVTYFKLKYLPNIQFTTVSSRRLFVKNALNFHRAKGSNRSVDLFFRLIYGVAANIYYPGDDLLRISDGEWVIPVYIEVTPNPQNKTFVGQQIFGVTSQSTAFVQSYAKIRVKGKYIDVLYLSDISGTFLAGELLRTSFSDLNGAPKVVGSTTSFNVTAGGSGFVVGEKVGMISDNGQFATGIVSNIATVIGAANVTLIDGGYGFNSNSEIIISDKTLLVGGISNSTFANLANLQEFYPNSSLASNSTIVGFSNNHIVTGQLVSGELFVGQTLSQGNVSAVITRVDKSGLTREISVSNVSPYFVSGVQATTTSGIINVSSYATLVGIANISGPGIYTSNHNVAMANGANGFIISSSQTTNALSFSFASNNQFTNMKTANVGLDYVRVVANTRLNAVQFNLPKAPTVNVSSNLMITALFYETRNYGTISNNSIRNLYAGSGYAQRPFILVLEKLVYDRRKETYELLIDSKTSNFIPGERITTGTRDANNVVFESSNSINGIVISSTDTAVYTRRLAVDRIFYEHDPQNYMIIGETSGATARIRKVNNPVKPPLYIGLDANLDAEVFSSNGLVREITLATSGYGHIDQESVTFFSLTDPDKVGQAILRARTHGIGAGYYLVKGGSLSDNRYIQDNEYYQDYSYEIQTSVQSDSYKQMFDQVLHVAGTKGFYSYLSVENLNQPITISENILETDLIALDFSDANNSFYLGVI